MSLDFIESELPKLTAQYAAQFSSASHSDRSRALAAATAAATAARERDRALRQQEDALAGARTDASIAAWQRSAEDQRRSAAAQLLAEAFDTGSPTSLASLVGKWRIEPSRQTTLQIRQQWSDLDARAHDQLGAPLGDHVLAVCFIDLICASMPGALLHLSASDCGTGQRGVEALGAFRRAAAPGAAQAALEALEDCLLTAGRRGAGQAVEQVQIDQHALRRQCATHADLQIALASFGAEAERVRLARFAAAYEPPPMRPPSLISKLMPEWLGGGA